MIAKIILYAVVFIIVRSWLKLLFKPKEKISTASHKQNFKQKDVFEADFKVVNDD